MPWSTRSACSPWGARPTGGPAPHFTSGMFQLALGLGVGVEAGVKLFIDGLPDTTTMGVFGVIALLVNSICFLLLSRYRDGDINLRATWICSRNDMLGNVGVLVAAGLVNWLGALWPDIAIGLLIAAVVVRSAVRVVREARGELRGEKKSTAPTPIRRETGTP